MPVVPPTEPAVCTRNIGLPDRAERVGQVELGLHDALEQVGGLAEHHGVDVGHGHVGVVEGPEDGLADEPAERHVAPAGLVVGLADPDDGAGEVAHDRPSRMQTRFCCRQGPDVEWAERPGAAAEDVVGGVADAAQARSP